MLAATAPLALVTAVVIALAGSGQARADQDLPVAAAPAPTSQAAGAAVDFIDDARALLRVGACGAGELPAFVPATVVDPHCRAVGRIRARFAGRWLAPARAFFAGVVPSSVPRRVVYPFAGGDLTTALVVFPDADEITTLSLEPAGDPRTLPVVRGAVLTRALEVVRTELDLLYGVKFSYTKHLVGAMRAGHLPTQLIFGLVALDLAGLEPVAVRYFEVADDGSLRYLDAAAVAAIGTPSSAQRRSRNRAFGNVEITFRTPGQDRVRVYRHLIANLDDAHLARTPGVLRHLQAKGDVAAMTKAASYLLDYEGFSTIRTYLLDHAAWMVSDATGVPPRFLAGRALGHATWGRYASAHMNASRRVVREWSALFRQQPAREMPIRFGYPDGSKASHLVVMSRR